MLFFYSLNVAARKLPISHAALIKVLLGSAGLSILITELLPCQMVKNNCFYRLMLMSLLPSSCSMSRMFPFPLPALRFSVMLITLTSSIFIGFILSFPPGQGSLWLMSPGPGQCPAHCRCSVSVCELNKWRLKWCLSFAMHTLINYLPRREKVSCRNRMVFKEPKGIWESW